MSVLKPGEEPGFEAWIQFNYPELFEEWEVTASEYLELEEWIDHLHWLVLDEWRTESSKKGGETEANGRRDRNRQKDHAKADQSLKEADHPQDHAQARANKN